MSDSVKLCVRCKQKPAIRSSSTSYSYCRDCYHTKTKNNTDKQLHKMADAYRPKERAE